MKEFIIDCTGSGIRTIFDDELVPLLAEGEARITRASEVEPGLLSLGQNPAQWYTNLAKSGGPILGGFNTRQEALDQEVQWLKANDLGRRPQTAPASNE